MKTKLRIALGALLAIALFVVALPISSAAPPSPITVLASSPDHQERGERTHVKQGQEVGKRVKQLQKLNKNVGAALEKFEENERRTQNGHKPKHDASFSATIDPDSGAPPKAALKMTDRATNPFRKVAFVSPQEPDYSTYGAELIFIPSYVTDSEWQGTVIINGFDPSGAFLGQYVADVAMVANATQTLDVVYELSYSDGVGYITYGNPGFELGTPTYEQPVNLISSARKPDFRKTSFEPSPAVAPQLICPFGCPVRPRVQWVMKCTAIGSAGIAARCGIGLLLGGGPYVPCQLAGSAGVFTVCTLTAIFRS
jgi:hypothetical protein